jgi:protein O-mannosyl-transferase
VSKAKTKQQPAKASAPAIPATPVAFVVRYPLLWLALAVVVVYFPSLSFGLTDLDDTIFIRDFHSYNEQIGNLITSFHRGLFDAVKDPYYRPLFLDSMILNYQAADHGTNIALYHIVNVLLHIGAVSLLYTLFRKLGIRELHAFLLGLIFAIHPVLSQAVAWIPGRNDTMLAIFVCSFLICSVDYTNNGRASRLGLSVLFLLLALFTKETAVFAAPVAFVLLSLVVGKRPSDKRAIVQYGLWAGCLMVWYLVRASATVNSDISLPGILHELVSRLMLIVQYIGKVVLPVNLSVFPLQQDTVNYYGFAAIVLMVLAIALARGKDMKQVMAGIAVFLLFLFPVLIVPSKLNEQTFEHRLYLPMAGILLLLPQTILFRNRLTDKQLMAGGIGIALVLAVVSYKHQERFSDPVTFWKEAMDTSPHSAYATMMYAARLDKSELEGSATLFRKAYALNPREKYLNLYIGEMLQKKDSVLASGPYLLTEKKISNYYECDFYLARVAMEQKDFNGAVGYLQAYLKNDPANPMANNNLLLLLMQLGRTDEAKAQVTTMRSNGMNVPQQILQQLKM